MAFVVHKIKIKHFQRNITNIISSSVSIFPSHSYLQKKDKKKTLKENFKPTAVFACLTDPLQKSNQYIKNAILKYIFWG